MRRSLSPLVIAAAALVAPGCIVIDVGGDGGFGMFGDESFVEFGEDRTDDSIQSARVRGDIGPSRGVDGDGRVDGWVSPGSISAEVQVLDQDGAAVLSIVDIYGLDLSPGQRSTDVSVVGCSGEQDWEDEYEYDGYSDDAEAVVVDCGCDEEGVVDVVVMSNFQDDFGYGAQQHTTTLRISN